jgi:hypothetical protein
MHALYAMYPCSYSPLLDSADANRDRHTVVHYKIHHLGAILFAYIGPIRQTIASAAMKESLNEPTRISTIQDVRAIHLLDYAYSRQVSRR